MKYLIPPGFTLGGDAPVRRRFGLRRAMLVRIAPQKEMGAAGRFSCHANELHLLLETVCNILTKGNSMPSLKETAQLKDFQEYVAELEVERGFSEQGPKEKCLMLGEEVGELFKAVRKEEGLAIDKNSKVGDIKEELADIFIYLCSIANRYDVDLESAFREKEEKNKKRTWS